MEHTHCEGCGKMLRPTDATHGIDDKRWCPACWLVYQAALRGLTPMDMIMEEMWGKKPAKD